MIQQHKNHRYVHNTFSPVCLFHIRRCAHRVIVTQGDTSNTTIIKTEFDLEVRKHTKTDYVCGSACRHAMLGKITAQEGECARYRPPQVSESVWFAESCECKRTSMGSVSAKTDPQGTCRHRAQCQRGKKAYGNITMRKCIQAKLGPTILKFIMMQTHLVRCLRLLPLSRTARPRSLPLAARSS